MLSVQRLPRAGLTSLSPVAFSRIGAEQGGFKTHKGGVRQFELEHGCHRAAERATAAIRPGPSRAQRAEADPWPGAARGTEGRDTDGARKSKNVAESPAPGALSPFTYFPLSPN